MKINFKTPVLLVSSLVLCLTTSCGPKEGSDSKSSEESTQMEALGAETSLLDDDIKEDATVAATASPDAASTADVFSEDFTFGRGQWDPSSQMYNDDPRHLFWDLSFYKNWNTFEERRMNKYIQCVVENADNRILAALIAYPLVDKKITSVWELPKQAVLDKIMAIQKRAFGKTRDTEPVIEKITFRNKSAYQIKYTSEVPDPRRGENEYPEYKVRMVVMVSGHEMLELLVMAPPAALDRFGEDTFTFLIGKFNFVE